MVNCSVQQYVSTWVEPFVKKKKKKKKKECDSYMFQITQKLFSVAQVSSISS